MGPLEEGEDIEYAEGVGAIGRDVGEVAEAGALRQREQGVSGGGSHEGGCTGEKGSVGKCRALCFIHHSRVRSHHRLNLHPPRPHPHHTPPCYSNHTSRLYPSISPAADAAP
jgi:hypothetical protein